MAGVWALIAALVTGAFVSSAAAQDPSDEPRCLGLYAVLSAEEIKARFLTLNPHLKSQDIDHKIGAAKSAFKLNRAVVPAFYDSYTQLKKAGFSPAARQNLERLEQYDGWMYGDVHPENFGAVLNDDGKAVFTINDLDDGGRGPVFLDLLRYLTSLRLHDRKLDPQPWIESYARGLGGKSVPKSKWLDEFLAAAEEDGRVTKKRLHDSAKHGIKRDETMRELSQTQREALEQAIRAAFQEASGGKLLIRDSVEIIRDRGGSGGQKRYLVLAKVGKRAGSESKHVLLELKQIVDSGMQSVWRGERMTAQERMRAGVAHSQGAEASRYLSAVRVGDMDMLVRPKFRGNSGVDLDELSKKQAAELLDLEAHMLGSLHRRGMADPDGYSKALRETPASTFTEASRKLADLFEEEFNALRPGK